MSDWLRLVRPSHWTKNLAAFAGVIFGGRLGEPWALGLDLAVFLLLCAVSSAVYIVNDASDLAYDRAHASKRNRPLAAGRIKVGAALSLAGVLAGGALVASLFFHAGLTICLLAYLILNLLYSLRLKHVQIVDVLCIALGFALRVLAGIYVLGDLPTAWIVLCAFFLALFLALGKRRAELGNKPGGDEARPVLEGYNSHLLDSLLDGSATTAILTYALFTATSGKNPSLIVTVPIVYYAISYYRGLLTTTDQGTEPERILLQNPVIQGCLLLWILTFVAISYGQIHFFR